MKRQRPEPDSRNGDDSYTTATVLRTSSTTEYPGYYTKKDAADGWGRDQGTAGDVPQVAWSPPDGDQRQFKRSAKRRVSRSACRVHFNGLDSPKVAIHPDSLPSLVVPTLTNRNHHPPRPSHPDSVMGPFCTQRFPPPCRPRCFCFASASYT